MTVAEDKKSAKIELTSKLSKGDYTVSVKNGEQTLTGTVTAIKIQLLCGQSDLGHLFLS